MAYDKIIAVRLQNPIAWRANQVTNITSALANITVDADAEIVTLVDPDTKKTMFVPFDNIVSLEQAMPESVKAAASKPATEAAPEEEEAKPVEKKSINPFKKK